MSNFPNWADHIVALILGILLPVYLTWRNPKDQSGVHYSSMQKKKFYISASISLSIMGAIVIANWLIFSRPFSILGFKQPEQFPIWWWIPLVFLFLFALDSFMAVVKEGNRKSSIEQLKKTTPFMPTLAKELPLYSLMCLSAAVFEELIYRGFLITYCMELFSGFVYSEYWAIIIPAVVFSVAHYYQGIKAVVKILFFSIFFGIIFIFSRSLLIVVILHFIVDFTGGILTMKYLKTETEYSDPFT